MPRDYYKEPCENPVGDWEFYKWRMNEFRTKVMPERSSDMQESMRLQGGGYLQQYFGDEPRVMTKEPSVLTSDFVAKLAVENQARRWRQHPHFVKIASMFNHIEELENQYERNK